VDIIDGEELEFHGLLEHSGSKSVDNTSLLGAEAVPENMALIPDIDWIIEQKRNILLGTLVFQLVIGITFSISTFSIGGACYVQPCYWAVTPGMTFQATFTGFLYILQPIYALYFLKNRCTQIVGGGFLGATALLVALSLVTAVLWSAEPAVARAFLGEAPPDQSGAIATTQAGEISQEVLSLDQGAAAAMGRLAALAGWETAAALLGLALLALGREHFCEDDYAVAAARSKIRAADSQFYTYQGVSLIDDDENLGKEDFAM